ncbi:hypothetical protein [Actinomadura xylanilytica]|uniref:hypothetical protein n=1 Tax=Actinomadura xylanilytica TaxID=887459 RepID=UPI00255B0ADE|nr:hypothetical protein [Actinomadura xylanilytica]MDL4776330.1 hypothetical protein [Actinomadura xylanilytica]
MDLEDELRAAMVEHVADASAPATLAGDVRGRYRRRVARIRVALGVGAAAVVAVAIIPGYQSFRAGQVSTPAASDGPAGRGGPDEPGRAMPQPVPSRTSGAPAPVPSRDIGGTESPRPLLSHPPGQGGPDGPSGDGGPAPGWMTYLPSGLRALRPCAELEKGGRRTTNCRWSGTNGWVEVHITRGSGLAGPGDVIDGAPTAGGTPVAGKDRVHGHPAVTTDRPDRGRQIAWVERPGVGILVLVGPALRDELLTVAEGVRP